MQIKYKSSLTSTPNNITTTSILISLFYSYVILSRIVVESFIILSKNNKYYSPSSSSSSSSSLQQNNNNIIPFTRNRNDNYHHRHRAITTKLSSSNDSSNNNNEQQQNEHTKKKKKKKKRARYDLGITTENNSYDYVKYLSMPEPVNKTKAKVMFSNNNNYRSNTNTTSSIASGDGGEKQMKSSSSSGASSASRYELGIGKNQAKKITTTRTTIPTLLTITNDDIEECEIWNKDGYLCNPNIVNINIIDDNNNNNINHDYSKTEQEEIKEEEVIALTYDQLDANIPSSVYSPSQNIDLVWDLMKQEALIEANREPLLVSFLHSSILNHPTLESALAFHLANRLSSPHMLSTQIMSLILESLKYDEEFAINVRADMLAVRDRDPACTCLPDVFLYFKGFHALQSYRVAHYFYKMGRKVLAHYLQSQVSQSLQIDIHPNATLGRGIMLDHGTGIVIGETAVIGHNCSILHHVTLGGSGRRGVDRHPKIGNGVLIGAGSSILGNINVGNGAQIGAGTLVIMDLPSHCVAVGVPARIVGTYADEVQPSLNMNQDVGTEDFISKMSTFEMDNI